MARTAIVTQVVDFQSGEDITFAAADQANGMTMENDGQSILLVKNDDASVKQVTIVSVKDELGRLGDIVKTVAATTIAVFAPTRAVGFNQRSGDDVGKTQVDFDADTSVTVAVLKIQK